MNGLTDTPLHTRTNLLQIAIVFLKLGTTAFGGPAAHVAMMNVEIVEKRGWVTRERFLDYLSAANLIPGPNSTELAIHLGYARGGWRGLLVAGTCFIGPAALIAGGCAYLYVRFGALPSAQHVLYGIKPVIVAIVAQAIWNLGSSALKSRFLIALGTVAAAANLGGADELLVIGVGGLASWLRSETKSGRVLAAGVLPGLASTGGVPSLGSAAAAGAGSATVAKVFFFFAKVGSVLFGSGYVLLAFLRADLVERWHWLTNAQLLDAIAVGQVTPGPVFTTATFIGYVLAGTPGAVAATVGIFLPAFGFVALTAPFLGRLRRSIRAAAVLDGVNVASLAVMFVTWLTLAKGALIDGWTGASSVLALLMVTRFRINSAWLILLGAAVGALVGAD